MKTYSDKGYVELFHLFFLAQLGRKVAKSAYALKGGCNLRFFFGSPRYSEDIDLDVSELPVHKLEDRVGGILASTPFRQILQVRGIGIEHINGDKQTETTQRWKIGLTIPKVEKTVPTKIEFSRRGMGEDRSFGTVDAAVTAMYEVSPVMVMHYSKQSAFQQKIKALADRRETQARDIFDLYLLASQGANTSSAPPDILGRTGVARDNVMLVDYSTFKAQVLAYLPIEDQEVYDECAWDAIRLAVLEALEEEPK